MEIKLKADYFCAMSQDTYTIRIKQFEGPFDLLLFFIERDEIDIHDIPIAKITNDYLEYIRDLEELNLNVASEFILMAATLMRIKAKMLIPRKPVDEDGNEIDPREELVQRLLEYKRYKEVLDDISILEQERSLKEHRGNISSELKQIANKALVDLELESLTLYNLLKAFDSVMTRFENRENRVRHEIVKYNYKVEEQQSFILNSIYKKGSRLTFQSLFDGLENRIHAIVTFLAVLELANAQRIWVTQGLGINNFWLSSEAQKEEEE